MALQLKSFAQPDLLKRIQSQNLILLLEPHRLFFDMKGFSLPAGDPHEIEYLTLAGILAQPDEDMPSDLVEALHVIGNFSGDEHFDDLLKLAQQAGLDVEGDATTPDLATRIYLRDPQVLERKERERLFEQRKTFESYRAANPDDALGIEALPADLGPLERDLDKYFHSKRRGVGSRVIRKDSVREIRFLVQHGQTCKREPSRKGKQSTCTFFRPEKTDIVILDLAHNEMRINASSIPDLREYRALFGRHLFGNDDRFVFAQKYTLEPLRRDGVVALNCRDVEGIESVRLFEIEYFWAGAFDHVEIHKAEDLFKALLLINRNIETGGQLRRAVFRIKLDGEKKPRNVTIKAGNKSGYNRGEEATIIEDWLRARGFVLTQETVKDAQADSTLAGA
ncbi:MAG: hypothetical protein ABSB35_05875 [Bryobacteraceae bacterium]